MRSKQRRQRRRRGGTNRCRWWLLYYFYYSLNLNVAAFSYYIQEVLLCSLPHWLRDRGEVKKQVTKLLFCCCRGFVSLLLFPGERTLLFLLLEGIFILHSFFFIRFLGLTHLGWVVIPQNFFLPRIFLPFFFSSSIKTTNIQQSHRGSFS